jgi:hypothetical protein
MLSGKTENYKIVGARNLYLAPRQSCELFYE